MVLEKDIHGGGERGWFMSCTAMNSEQFLLALYSQEKTRPQGQASYFYVLSCSPSKHTYTLRD